MRIFLILSAILFLQACTATKLIAIKGAQRVAGLQCSLSLEVRAAQRLAYFDATKRVLVGWCPNEAGYPEAVVAHIDAERDIDMVRKSLLSGDWETAWKLAISAGIKRGRIKPDADGCFSLPFMEGRYCP